MINQEKLERDQYGMYTHSQCPMWDEGVTADEMVQWQLDNKVHIRVLSMESDDGDLSEKWAEDGLNDCNPWQPEFPENAVVLSIHDTEDGPVALYCFNHETEVLRMEDMSPNGYLKLAHNESHWNIEIQDGEGNHHMWPCVEFTTPFVGGGTSPCVQKTIYQFIKDSMSNADWRNSDKSSSTEIEVGGHRLQVMLDQDMDAYFSFAQNCNRTTLDDISDEELLGLTKSITVAKAALPDNWKNFMNRLFLAMHDDCITFDQEFRLKNIIKENQQ